MQGGFIATLSCSIWGTLILNNYSLFIWLSNLTGYPVFLMLNLATLFINRDICLFNSIDHSGSERVYQNVSTLNWVLVSSIYWLLKGTFKCSLFTPKSVVCIKLYVHSFFFLLSTQSYWALAPCLALGFPELGIRGTQDHQAFLRGANTMLWLQNLISGHLHISTLVYKDPSDMVLPSKSK